MHDVTAAEAWRCPACNARFATIADLTVHLQTHEKPVLPETLEEAFKREAENRKKRSNFPPIWDWNRDGATFVGKILTTRTITTSDRTWVAVECATPNGVTRTLAVGPKVLARLWDEKKPKVGDIVAVRNLGKPKGKRYYDFLLVVNPEGVEIPEETGKK
jgi:hypothetical protein